MLDCRLRTLVRMDPFKKRLADAMAYAKRDRAQLAAGIGVTVQAVGEALLGKTRAFTAENTAKAARFLKVDWYWLATGDGDMQPRASWPVQRIAVERFMALSPDDRAYVEGRIEEAIASRETTPTAVDVGQALAAHPAPGGRRREITRKQKS